ncbi:MAG: hypothetical protein IKF83_02885 [Clostridia bacterium]|nr:hypothetical protein [Clostridia bacterium]
MLERINIEEYRFREEGENLLLAFNVITSEMFFLKGKSKDYIISLLNNSKYDGKINRKNLEMLKDKKIILGG